MTDKRSIFQAITQGDHEPVTIVCRITATDELQLLYEGKWVSGRYDGNIRIDRNTHFDAVDASGVHAHVYGRRDRDKALVAVRLDGTKSHGLGGRLHDKDADTLRRHGFKIPADNIVEILLLPRAPDMLLNEAVEAGRAQ